MKNAFYIYWLIILLSSSIASKAQEVYYHVSNRAIYDFLDEMASLQLIDLNIAIKPYSRRLIAEKLQTISTQKEKLTKRQAAELSFYLKDFNKELLPGKEYKKRLDLFYYKDSLFTFSLDPIAGIQYWTNENGTNFHRWNGAEAFAYIGSHLAVYANLRDNHEKLFMADTGFLTTRPGANYKAHYDYSEMRGGITWSWKWGTLGLIKDHMEWGSGYSYPNIISSKAPSFAQIKLNLHPVKWFEFNYFHGWLVSEVLDSSRSYNYNGVQRDVMLGKWMAANMFTFKPFNNLFLSFGNSIVYSDIGVHPAYLIPIFFYKSVDHTYNSATVVYGQNSQMFFDFNYIPVRKIRLYGSWFIDELSIYDILDNKNSSNQWSIKGGVKLTDILPNLSIIGEYTRNNPFVYKNDYLADQFNSNWYNLGHYLKDNSDELFICLLFKPISQLSLKTYYTKARKGPDYPFNRRTVPGGVNLRGTQFMSDVQWSCETVGFSANYQILNDVYFFGEGEYKNVTGNQQRYTSSFYYGKTMTLSMGVNIGF